MVCSSTARIPSTNLSSGYSARRGASSPCRLAGGQECPITSPWKGLVELRVLKDDPRVIAPSSSVTAARLVDAIFMMLRPPLVLPVKQIFRTADLRSR